MATPSDVKFIFGKALELASTAERAAYLDQACGEDVALRAELEGLLEALANVGQFMSHPVGPLHGSAVSNEREETIGAPIGPYKLLQKLGEGGMGTVFLAEQEQPVKRSVALKVIKAGMDSRQIIARFEQEREALAMMDHPNIARVLDAGTTDLGRPYVVMELVKGISITRFCDQERLTPRERLELFIPVCHAVQHAHQKGIIHRDLKPSNVLIALYDGRPVPKVIDFGVAKAIGRTMAERTLFTEVGVLVGTMEYMAPEQAELNNLDIDTRADIYSLGIILYELLTGAPPFTSKQLQEAGFAEMLRFIKEVEPPKPSTKLSSSEELPSIAATRKLEPKSLTKLVTGELDWIVMKCLEKERGRRYDAANGLARDIQRYLDDEPVEAGPPSRGYRLRKFLKRNKAPVLAVSIIFLLLVGGIVGTTLGLMRERRAKETAEKRLVQIEKGIDAMGSIFADLDPQAEEKEGRPLRAILGDRLDQTAAELDGEAIGDPLVVAKLQDRLGATYLGLGHAAKAESLFTKARATRAAELGADHPLTLASANHLAVAFEAVGKRSEAIDLFEQVRDAQVKKLGADHLDTLGTMHSLGVAYWFAGRPIEAIALLEPVRDAQVKKLGDDHPDTLGTVGSLAGAYLAAGKKSEAVALSEHVRDALVKKFGDDHPRSIDALHNLSGVHNGAGNMRKSLALMEEARDAIVPKLGPEHPRSLKFLNSLAWNYRAFGRTAEAIALAERVRDAQVMALGARHPSTIFTLYNLALAYQADGKREQALALFQQAAVGVEKLKFAHGHAGVIIRDLCKCHEQLKQYDEADVWRRKWLAAVKERDGPESSTYVGTFSALGASLLQRKKHADAEPILRESLAINRKMRPNDGTTYYIQSLLGSALLGQQKFADAKPLLLQAYQGMKNSQQEVGPQHSASALKARLIETIEFLVAVYEATGDNAEADRWKKELETRKQVDKDGNK